jgi:anaerobic selenocysteine-containing dehydrogenase
MTGTTTVRTTCKIGACEPYCGVEIDVEDGVMVAVRGDKTHPVSQGYLCVKGHNLLEYQNDPDRLLRPLRRTETGFEQAAWSAATDDIGHRLRSITDEHGPDSVATYWGNAADSANIVLALTTAGAFGSRNTFNVLSLEFTDRGAVASRVYGDEGVMLQPDADHAAHALLLGTNPVVTQGMALLQRRPHIRSDLRDIQRRGGSLTVVDPRETETTSFADHHLAIRPGTDLFFLVGLITHILRHDLADRAWLRQHADGLDEWERLGRAVDLDRISRVCDLARSVIEGEAERFAGAETAFATTRVGVQTGPNTTLTEWAVTTLNAITGNIARPGGMIFHGGATEPSQYLLDGLLRNNFTPSRIGGHSHIFGGLPTTELADDILSDDDDRVRALIVFAGNPVISFPDTAKIEAALERLDLLVCFDIYHSDTGAFADWTLPATTQFEKSSMHFMVDKYEPTRRIEWKPQVVEPAGEARSEWDAMQDICVAADAPFLNNPRIHEEVVSHRNRGTHYPEQTMYEGVLPEGITLDDVIASPGGIELPSEPSESFFTRHVTTESGRIELAPTDLVEGLDRLLARADEEPDDQFPLWLISGQRRLRSFNTWTHNMPRLTEPLDEPTATIHPDLAARHGLVDGDAVDLRTANGAIRLRVTVKATIRPDTVAVPQFWGHEYESGQRHARRRPGVNVNRLHGTDDVDTYTAMPVFNGRPCAIDPVGN